MALKLRSEAAAKVVTKTVGRIESMNMDVIISENGEVLIEWYGIPYNFETVEKAHAWFLKYDKNSPWEEE